MKVIDVSTFQGKIDWQKVKNSGVGGAMLRAGYGQGNIDAQFRRNAAECNRLGIPFGVYWFSYAKTAQDAIREANYCLNAIAPFKVELPVAYDYEYDSEKENAAVTTVQRTSFVYAFCCQIQAAGYYSMVYTNGDYLRNRFGDISPFDLWYAAWTNNPNLGKAPVNCGIWQWGTSTVDGIGNVDTNECYRDYPKIIKAAGLNKLAEKEPKKVETAEEKLDRILAELTEWKTGGKQQ